MRKARYLIAGLALGVLLAAGAGTAYAISQINSMMSGGVMDGRDDSMGSMSSMMGSFDKEKPFDLQFIDQMTMHHEGAIMSSEHMISDSKRPELRMLAADIKKSQSEQIDQMQEWRDEWYPDAEHGGRIRMALDAGAPTFVGR
ncbi:MAG: DUF305 domain-containing protein, partial [Rubrobacteraceae bacterium]|nr:DUF305 domain-containing protein [Rubrobacteraceae bacterium]